MLTYLLLLLFFCLHNIDSEKLQIDEYYHLFILVPEAPNSQEITKALQICVTTDSMCPASFLNLQDYVTILVYICS